MADSGTPTNPRPPNPPPADPDEGRQPPPAREQPAEEWGQREATGRQIAAGGKAPERPPGETPRQPD